MLAKILLLLSLNLAGGLAQAQISATVTNIAGDPLEGANVITASGISTTTNSAGRFVISTGEPGMEATISLTGYKVITLTVSDGMVIRLQKDISTLNEVRIQAFESNMSARKATASVSVIDSAMLNSFSNISFVPAFNTVPGVKMDERSPGSYRLSIRGNLLRSTFGVRNVKVYWNGIPFTDANGNTYLNQVGFNNVTSAEIIKGPSGSMYGAGTGGVLLLKTDNHQDNNIQLDLKAGSYGLFGAAATLNTSGNNISSKLSYAHQQSEGYRDHTEMRRSVAHYLADINVNTKNKLHANIFYSDLFYETPGGLNAAELAANPRQSRPAAGIFNGAVKQQAALYLKTLYTGLALDHRFNSRWSNTTGGYFSATRFRNPTIRNYERRSEQGVGGRTIFRYNHDKFNIVSGGEYQYSFNNAATYGNRSGVSDTLQYQDEIDNRQFNVFLQAGIQLNKLLLTTGVSYNNFHYGLIRVSEAGATKESSDFKPQVIPRIAAAYALNDNINLYASASKGYSPPSLEEVHASNGIFNTALRAESGNNYEAGIRTNWRNRLTLDATYYIFNLENTIVSRKDAGGADYYINAGKTDQKGLEIAFTYSVLQNPNAHRDLRIRAAYTHISARFKDYKQGTVTYDGNKLTGTPPQVVSAGADFKLGIFYSSLNYTYTDAIPLNDANTFYATRYNLWHGRAGVLFNRKKSVIDVYIAREMSTNNPYSLGNDLNAAGNRFYNPSAPNMFTAGAKFIFNYRRS